MKNYEKFTALTEQETVETNGGAVLDGLLDTLQGVLAGLPIIGGLTNSLLNTIKGLLGNLPLPL
ncbi:MAG: hypothetical protein P0Y53_08950 [Candidatus Pseudobacter hemicellulosilyticus]|uniref:Uncharacterized protein n=1 Tax=Candidatus Pseudobacter hemicellulosilyticus TaxID=3121375 RepID=A0AAJ5WUH5_9BACT|nr:MAG: hypothetical protein P0Y53_08950 [Pseudobacter sp.]